MAGCVAPTGVVLRTLSEMTAVLDFVGSAAADAFETQWSTQATFDRPTKVMVPRDVAGTVQHGYFSAPSNWSQPEMVTARVRAWCGNSTSGFVQAGQSVELFPAGTRSSPSGLSQMELAGLGVVLACLLGVLVICALAFRRRRGRNQTAAAAPGKGAKAKAGRAGAAGGSSAAAAAGAGLSPSPRSNSSTTATAGGASRNGAPPTGSAPLRGGLGVAAGPTVGATAGAAARSSSSPRDRLKPAGPDSAGPQGSAARKSGKLKKGKKPSGMAGLGRQEPDIELDDDENLELELELGLRPPQDAPALNLSSLREPVHDAGWFQGQWEGQQVTASCKDDVVSHIQYDVESLERALEGNGFEVVASGQPRDHLIKVYFCGGELTSPVVGELVLDEEALTLAATFKGGAAGVALKLAEDFRRAMDLFIVKKRKKVF